MDQRGTRWSWLQSSTTNTRHWRMQSPQRAWTGAKHHAQDRAHLPPVPDTEGCRVHKGLERVRSIMRKIVHTYLQYRTLKDAEYTEGLNGQRNIMNKILHTYLQCLTMNDAESTEGLIGLQNIMSATETAYLNYLRNPIPVVKTPSELANFTFIMIQQAGSERCSC